MKKTLVAAVLLTSILPLGTTSQARGGSGQSQEGFASYYHDSFHGRKTASGQRYNKHRLTAAHRTLPLGTKIRVTNAKTGKSIVVKVNDRGPYARGRILDLSKEAASELGMVKRGIAKVELKVLSLPSGSGS